MMVICDVFHDFKWNQSVYFSDSDKTTTIHKGQKRLQHLGSELAWAHFQRIDETIVLLLHLSGHSSLVTACLWPLWWTFILYKCICTLPQCRFWQLQWHMAGYQTRNWTCSCTCTNGTIPRNHVSLPSYKQVRVQSTFANTPSNHPIYQYLSPQV